MYSPVLNRFTSRDPLPLEGEPDILYGDDWVNRNIVARMNLYAYVENNPVNYVDPSGLGVTAEQTCKKWGAAQAKAGLAWLAGLPNLCSFPKSWPLAELK